MWGGDLGAAALVAVGAGVAGCTRDVGGDLGAAALVAVGAGVAGCCCTSVLAVLPRRPRASNRVLAKAALLAGCCGC